MTSFLPPWAMQNVSRETMAQLEKYVVLLQKWNKAINLVGKSTVTEIWQRHIADSLQLLPLLPSKIDSLADLGSGAGLPGMVVAISRPDIKVTLIEQDQRKAAFLQETIAQLQLKNCIVLNRDIQAVTEKFCFITGRALASLDLLFSMAFSLRVSPETICLFPKGKNVANELEEAQKNWIFDFDLIHSLTQEEASIVSITKLNRKH